MSWLMWIQKTILRWKYRVIIIKDTKICNRHNCLIVSHSSRIPLSDAVMILTLITIKMTCMHVPVLILCIQINLNTLYKSNFFFSHCHSAVFLRCPALSFSRRLLFVAKSKPIPKHTHDFRVLFHGKKGRLEERRSHLPAVQMRKKKS